MLVEGSFAAFKIAARFSDESINELPKVIASWSIARLRLTCYPLEKTSISLAY
jgi:hypothetical protein